jgi:hypothetical protein
MSLLPEPAPLDPPPGSPDAVEDAARDASAAARFLDELTDRLNSARTPAWQGADAEAAEARRSRLARLADQSAETLHSTASRLGDHAEVLREVQARLAVLRAAQDSDFAVARSRVALPLDPTDPLAADPEDVVAALRAADADRRAEHARLVARAEDDAAATIRVLAGVASAVAGTPRYDSDAALLRLAVLLPAWGTPEVARRGALLARAVRHGTPDGGEMGAEALQAAARADLDLAADPAYASAFLAGLGPVLARGWLGAAWSGAAADDPRTDLFARTLSALDRDGAGPPWLAGLLEGASADGELAMVAGGVGAVLARAKALGLTGPPPAVAAAWARSLVREERAAGHATDLGVAPAGADPAATDPLALLADAVVEQRAARAAADLMSDDDAWTVVLSRFWNDPALRDSLVTTVADAPGEAARPALGAGLAALGTGLEDGDPDDWAFVEERIPEVAPVLATALLRHPDVLARPLTGAATGTADPGSVRALRGLAVTVALDEGTDPERRGAVGDRIARALSHPHPGALPVAAGAAAVAVPAAFVAVREHGARLAHAMEQHRRRDEAEARAYLWDWTLGLGFTGAGLAPGLGVPVAIAGTVLTDVLGADGSYTLGRDRRLHHRLPEAVAAADLARSGSAHVATAREAALAYARTLVALGTPAVPQERDESLAAKLVEATASEVAGGFVGRRLRIADGLDGIVGGAVVSQAKDLAGKLD